MNYKIGDRGEWTFKGAHMVVADGEKYKADTWYTAINGKVVEWED